MCQELDFPRGAERVESARGELMLAGGLMVGGLLVNTVSTLAHPAGHEDNHQVIFAKYADSGTWEAVHLGQFVGVLLALGGLLVLHRVVRTANQRRPLIARLAASTTVATAAVWAVLQGLDGVGLKQAVDAWVSASGAERAVRFASAETVRWLEWGFQSYFRALLGLSFVLFGAAILTGRRIASWLGWTSVLGGLSSVVIGVDVAYNGLASGLQDALSLAFLVLVLVFAFGLLATGIRERDQHHAGT